MDKKKIVLWVLQIICIAILLPAALAKFNSDPSSPSVEIFTVLGMEPYGRYIIASLEILACIFMLTNRFAATGSFLAMGIMMGAIIAHASILGVNVFGDGGKHVALLSVVFICSLTVTILRRKQLPLIGNTF